MSNQLEDIINQLEKRITALERLCNKESVSVANNSSTTRNITTAKRIQINSTNYIDADGTAYLKGLQLSGDVREIYFGDPNTNGTWYMHANDGNWHLQCRINGVYIDQILQTSTNEESL